MSKRKQFFIAALIMGLAVLAGMLYAQTTAPAGSSISFNSNGTA